MVGHLRKHQLLATGWSYQKGGGGWKRVERSLLAESWNPAYAGLSFSAEEEDPAYLVPAVEELAKSDAQR